MATADVSSADGAAWLTVPVPVPAATVNAARMPAPAPFGRHAVVYVPGAKSYTSVALIPGPMFGFSVMIFDPASS